MENRAKLSIDEKKWKMIMLKHENEKERVQRTTQTCPVVIFRFEKKFIPCRLLETRDSIRIPGDVGLLGAVVEVRPVDCYAYNDVFPRFTGVAFPIRWRRPQFVIKRAPNQSSKGPQTRRQWAPNPSSKGPQIRR